MTQSLTLRDINRMTLARQMLLERSDISPVEAVEHLVGLQAQSPVAPYISLWTRLRGFKRDDLAQQITERKIVKATLMRATLHLFSADDYRRFRATLRPALEKAAQSIAKTRGSEPDVDEVVAAARRFLAEKPRSFAEISAMLEALKPGEDIGAMRFTVRTHLPLVQVPAATQWSYPGNPRFALAEDWLGGEISQEMRLHELIRRYLAAFGPASAADFQTWLGLPKANEAFEQLKPELVTYRDERGRLLFDLPDMPLPSSDAAPVRFLPEYDNLLLSHKDRTRIVADEYRPALFFKNLRFSPFLVDGFVQGVWRIEKAKNTATLVIQPFAALDARYRSALEAEGLNLLQFAAADAKAFAVQFEG